MARVEVIVNCVVEVTAVTSTGQTFKRESVLPINMIRSFGTRPCAVAVLIVQTFVATVILPEIDIFDGGVNVSTVPDASVPITPNADSTPTSLCDIDKPDSAT